MNSSYKKHEPSLFNSTNAHSLVAELLIFREFARRPRRQNNLETLGLISLEYPSIDELKDAPYEWKTNGLTVEEWKIYLKLCMDFFVRAGGSLDGSNRNLEYWLGLPFYKSYLIGQDEEKSSRYQRKWPTARRGKSQSRIVRLLIKLLGVDADSATGEDIIDETLRKAWKDLKKTNTLEKKENGYVLDLNDISFTIPDKVWICPVTRRFLDKTIQRITPYLPKTLDGNITCEEYTIPRYTEPFGNTQNPFKNVDTAQNWLKEQESVEYLRKHGYWNLYNDRVIEYMPYYETAEHSAQIDSDLLKHYEKQFKNGQINILSCSTTMEMGIDIGGIRMVGMNNLPPHPANYLQRAGRAGRRNETRSTTMTLCKPNPHDLTAFRNSKWAFETKLPAPTVALNSKVIVQRHINAFVLSFYLNYVIGLKGVDKHKLVTGWFFTNTEQGVDKYKRWLEELNINNEFSQGIRMLIRDTVFDGTIISSLLDNASSNIDEIYHKWNKEYENVQNQKQELLKELDEKSPELKAITHQENRLTGEYLLRELASKGYLPGYGFPSNITAFDHYNISTYKQDQKRKHDDSRDDNISHSRDLPSRDIVTALREYAPGAEVVIDGAVYKSRGITLNWHIPTTAKDVSESQAIKFAWRCSKCGNSGSTFDKQNTLRCDNCGSEIRNQDIEQYLEPSGFSVDFYEQKHNDVTTQTYIPIEKPWIQVNDDWKSLSNPQLGKFKATTNGHIFHFSKGEHTKGYALCLMCGRAEPMDKNGEMPRPFKNGKKHKKLRGGKEVCSGSNNSWAIKEDIALGHQMNTDVLQIVLKSTKGEWLTDRDIAATLAVVLRDSLADLLGIESRELLCDVNPVNIDQREVQSIFIFDRRSSGFSSNSGHLINRIFEEAREQLICPSNCEASCPNCVLDYDQRFRKDELDRHRALEFLTDEWIKKNQLPTELNYFEEYSEIEQDTIYGAFIKELGAEPGDVYLFVDGDPKLIDIPDSSFRQVARRLSMKGYPIHILFNQNLYEEMLVEDRFAMVGLLQYKNTSLYTSDTIPAINGAKVVAAIKNSKGWKLWASEESKITYGNAKWGKVEDDFKPLVKGKVESFDFKNRKIPYDELKNSLKGKSDIEISIKKELNSRLHSFGKGFWEYIANNHEETKNILLKSNKKIERVEYSDRYLYNPLSLGLVHSIVKGLHNLMGADRWNNSITKVTTTHKSHNFRPGNMIYHDWTEPEDRDDVFEILFDKSGFNFDLIIADRRNMEHGRAFDVVFEDGSKLTVRLDQGVGYWKVKNPRYSSRRSDKQHSRFEFSSIDSGINGLEKEAEQVMKKNPAIVGDSYPTQVFVKLREEKSNH